MIDGARSLAAKLIASLSSWPMGASCAARTSHSRAQDILAEVSRWNCCDRAAISSSSSLKECSCTGEGPHALIDLSMVVSIRRLATMAEKLTCRKCSKELTAEYWGCPRSCGHTERHLCSAMTVSRRSLFSSRAQFAMRKVMKYDARYDIIRVRMLTIIRMTTVCRGARVLSVFKESRSAAEGSCGEPCLHEADEGSAAEPFYDP